MHVFKGFARFYLGMVKSSTMGCEKALPGTPGFTKPPDKINFMASSIPSVVSTTFDLSIIKTNPEVGLGVVGTKTQTSFPGNPPGA